jgi:paraquat-inducible protein B
MSKPINPTAIGGFTLGALALLIIGILVFGGAQYLHTDKIYYVIFFDSSLNGLDVGAPVKMQGVKIGTVTRIALQIDPKAAKVYKPVVVEIDRTSFVRPGEEGLAKGLTHAQQEDNRDKLVAAGFRARLEMQSLLTGLLYVDFDVYKDKPARFVGLDYQGMLELPAIPTTTDELRNTAEEVAKKLEALPLDQIVQDFGQTLREIRDLLASEEVKNSRVALARTLQEMEKAVVTLNGNLGPILKNTDTTIKSANTLMRDSTAMVQDMRRQVTPLLTSAHETLTTATEALRKAGSAVVTVEGAVGPQSTLYEALVALKDAARSIKDLSDYLERHPESLISGKHN